MKYNILRVSVVTNLVVFFFTKGSKSAVLLRGRGLHTNQLVYNIPVAGIPRNGPAGGVAGLFPRDY